MGMTFHTSPLKMAITILINMTQRTRNHSRKFILSVTATTVTKGKAPLPSLSPSSGLGWGRRAWTQSSEKRNSFPKDSPAAGPAEDPLWDMEPRSKAEDTHTQPHTRHCLLPSPVAKPEGCY